MRGHLPKGLAGTCDTLHEETFSCHMQTVMSSFSVWPMCASLCHIQAAPGMPRWQTGLGLEREGLAEPPPTSS